MKDGGPAFPNAGLKSESSLAWMNGMSLRDWFAGQATHMSTLTRCCLKGAHTETGDDATRKQN